jgi:hypothetical protein
MSLAATSTFRFLSWPQAGGDHADEGHVHQVEANKKSFKDNEVGGYAITSDPG